MYFTEEANSQTHTSYLFTLRMWLEDLGSGEVGWRGKVQHINSGEVRYFHDWSTMLNFVKSQLCNFYAEGPSSVEADELSKSNGEDTS
jgi:hypothetical protein